MLDSPPIPSEKSLSANVSERIPKQVKLGAWLSVFGAVVSAGAASATPIWPVAGACIGVAGMMAVVCYAVVRYR